MSKVDDELSRRFHRAERPVGSGDLIEGLARRRRRRRTLQRLEAGALAVVVLAATAGGFVALRAAFEGEEKRDIGEGVKLASNGEIVFANEADDDRLEIFASQPDGSGLQQLTDTELNDSDPAVSPDGTMVAYAHQTSGAGGATIATIPIEGGSPSWQTAEHHAVSDPVWSPDGTRIAFLSFTSDTSALYVADVGTDAARRIELSSDVTSSMPTDGLDTLEHPTWSPDGGRIAVAVRTQRASSIPSWDIVVMRPDGSGAEFVVATDTHDETVPAWSPDGGRIAFLQRPVTTPEEAEVRTEGDELWTVTADGGSPQLIAVAVDALLRLSVTWAPDGSSLLVSDGDWIYRVDATPGGDPRDNFVQLMRGFSPSWQPLPAGSEPSVGVSPAPSPSPSPEPEGRDIGLGFNLCNVERLGGIDFLGDGTDGQAWTGTPARETGRCPDQGAFVAYLVAADFDGDGAADTVSETLPDCFYCQPYDAADLDADGDEELVVLWSADSTPAFTIYALASGEIDPILVAEPGHPVARAEAGQPLTIATGGDEGYSGWVRCENFLAAPVLVVTWRDHPIEGDTMEVHETRFVLEDDGLFHVTRTNDYSAPVGDSIPGVSDEPACGVDWHPLPP